MTGEYLKNKTSYLNYLNSWKNTTIKTKGWQRFDDLHLDNVDKGFTNPRLWIDGGLFLYDCLLGLVDRNLYNCILCIPLRDAKQQSSGNQISKLYLQSELSLTPPSLYLFPTGEYNYEQTIKASTFLENLSLELNKEAYFKQHWEDEEYSRTIFIKE